jgi:hypothetical protein
MMGAVSLFAGVCPTLAVTKVDAVLMNTLSKQESGSDVAMDQDRRFYARVHVPYPARVWAVDTAGRAWKENVVLDNLSARGLYLRLNRSVQKDALLHVAVRLSTANGSAPALHLAARAVVLRVEPLPDGKCGVALEFGRRRVL